MRRRKVRRSRASVRPGLAATFAVILVAFAALAIYANEHPLNASHATVKPTVGLPIAPVPAVKTVAPSSNVVGIRWRAVDLAPAANAGRICVTDPKHGRICASYVVGERPADNLTRRIESLGLHVQSTG